MYLMLCNSPTICPVSDNPHHAPNSWTPPGQGHKGGAPRAPEPPRSAAASTIRGPRSRAAVVAVRDAAIFGANTGAPGGGSLQNVLALTTRESRYHGGRKRKMFAVDLAGFRNIIPKSANGFRLLFSRRRMTCLSNASSASVQSIPPTGVVTSSTHPVSFVELTPGSP